MGKENFQKIPSFFLELVFILESTKNVFYETALITMHFGDLKMTKTFPAKICV